MYVIRTCVCMYVCMYVFNANNTTLGIACVGEGKDQGKVASLKKKKKKAKKIKGIFLFFC